MSIRALLLGVEKRLRSAAVFDDQPDEAVGRYVGLMPAPGKPPANFGQWYAAIYWGGGNQTDKNPQRHDVMHAVTVTLTARLNYAPKDRQAKRLTTVGDIYDLVDRIAAPGIIHGSWDVVSLANELIPGTQAYIDAEGLEETATVNGFVETLVLDNFGPERQVGADWVGSETKDVYAIDIRFSRARRIQGVY
jgi:hypothetical protein